MIDSLEASRLLSATLVNGNLQVDCSSGSDDVQIDQDAGIYLVYVSFVGTGVTNGFPVSGIQTISVAGDDAIDSINVYGSVTFSTSINGGDGNDSIIAGEHDDTINGGNGNDTIDGGNGTTSSMAGWGSICLTVTAA